MPRRRSSGSGRSCRPRTRGTSTQGGRRASSSRAATRARPGSSTRRSGSSRPAPSGAPAQGACACTRLRRGPAIPSRIALAISAVGVWLTEDGGETWRQREQGPRTPVHPEEAREDTLTLCVHNMHRAPTRAGTALHAVPRRRLPLGRRRRDRGRHRRTACPSDFGFPMVIDPDDPDSAYVIPLVADMDRATPEGKVRVYETRDAGASVDAARRRPPAGRRVPHDPPAGVRPRGLRAEHGPLLRRDLG